MKKSLKISKAIVTIGKIILITIFVILVLYNIMNINNKEEYIEFLGYKIFVVQKYQEQQNIPQNTIIVAKSNVKNYNINDLVVVRY